jgi:outer membrane scaffolding protein for murein synthesis (MipA/OmpV family)
VLVYNDSDFANKDFGITLSNAVASGLNQSNLSGGFRSIGFHKNYLNNITKNWQILGELFFERYGNGIKRSPFACNIYEAEVGVGCITYFRSPYNALEKPD